MKEIYPSSVVNLAYDDSGASAALPTGAKHILAMSDTFCYIEFGDSAVAATTASIKCPPGVWMPFIIKDETYVAAIRGSSGADGSLQILKHG